MNTTTRRVARIVAGVLLAAAACGGKPAPVKVPRPVRLVAAEVPEGRAANRYSGNVEPRVRVDLAFKVAGYIGEILQVRGVDGRMRNVQEGDEVRAGDVLCQVRDDNYRVKLEQALGGLGQAEAALLAARRDYDRARPLHADNAIPKALLDGAEAKLDGTKAAVAYARGLVDEARVFLADTALKAPLDATVMKRLVEVGSLVGPGVGGFVLADTRSMRVVFGVPDAGLARFPMGAEVAVRLDAIGMDATGRVTRVSPYADPRTRIFDVEVTIPNGDGRIKAGMIASVTDRGGDVSPVPAVPLAAIVRPPGATEGYAVFTVEAGPDGSVARARRVRLGEVRGDRVEVEEGLAAGDRVVVPGASFLADGQAVTVVP